jgi:hypothetical protein
MSQTKNAFMAGRANRSGILAGAGRWWLPTTSLAFNRLATTCWKAAFCSYTHGSKSWIREKSCMTRLPGSASPQSAGDAASFRARRVGS